MPRAWPLAVLLPLVACGRVAPAPPAPPPPAPRLDPIAVGLDAIREADLVADVAWLAGDELRGRGSLTEEARVTASRLETLLRELGYEVSRQAIPAAPGQDNLIAILPGTEETVIVCAHYDHVGVVDGQVHFGADDNASGVAVALALARAAQAARRADPEARHRTILFLFSGAEELGLLGAAAYVRAPQRPLDRTRAVLNFDMVGRDFFEVAMGLPDTFAVVGLESDEWLGDAVRRAAEAEKVELVPVTASLVRMLGFDARTDDHVFRVAGVPAVHFSTALHADYHKPTDTTDKIKPKQLVHVARVAARTLLAVW